TLILKSVVEGFGATIILNTLLLNKAALLLTASGLVFISGWKVTGVVPGFVVTLFSIILVLAGAQFPPDVLISPLQIFAITVFVPSHLFAYHIPPLFLFIVMAKESYLNTFVPP